MTHFLIVVGYRADVVRDYFGDGRELWRRQSNTRRRSCRTAPAAWSSWRRSSPAPIRSSSATATSSSIRRTTIGSSRSATPRRSISVKHNPGEIAKGGAVFVNERFEMTDLREKPQPGEPTSPWYNAGRLHVSSEHFRVHRAAGEIAARRIRTDRRHPRAGAERAEGAGARTGRRLGRRARSRGARGVECAALSAFDRSTDRRAAALLPTLRRAGSSARRQEAVISSTGVCNCTAPSLMRCTRTRTGAAGARRRSRGALPFGIRRNSPSL